MSKSDTLEEEGALEFCKKCGSLHIVELKDGHTLCKNCLTVNYTDVCTEEEYPNMTFENKDI